MADLEFEVRSDSTRARRDLDRVNRSIGNIDNNIGRASRSLDGFTRSLRVGFAILSGGAFALGAVRATDALRNVTTQLGLVTLATDRFIDSQVALARAQSDVNRIALQARVDLGATGILYARLARAGNNLGASQEDIAIATQSVAQSVALSGANAESAAAAIIQLGQGLASGQLRGQELNSVLEQLPRAAQAIADDLMIGLGTLREMAAEGMITSEVVFGALVNQAGRLNDEFQGVQVTFSQAGAVLNTGITTFVGNLDAALGITGFIIDQVVSIGQTLNTIGLRIPSIFDSLSADIDQITTRIGIFFRGLTRDITSIFDFSGITFPSFDANLSSITEEFDASISSCLLYTSDAADE